MSSATLHFLSADVPLNKSFTIDSDGNLQKTSYPQAYNFTSHTVTINSLRDFYTQLVKHANAGHCLLKGTLRKDLNNESRAGSTKGDDLTNWVCLDLDGAPFSTIQQFMNAVPAFKDVAYIVQYSASSGINGNTKLCAHVFMMMDGKLPAPNLKTQLMSFNLNIKEIRAGITLSSSNAALHWPLDVTVCQNDKLLFIAPPIIGKGVKCTVKESERIQLVPGKRPLLSTKDMQCIDSMEKVKESMRTLINDLRKAAKLPPLRSSTKWVGEYEVQPKPGEATITGRKEERGYVYFNLNGGDSWGYYHPVGKPDLIGNFKSEPYYHTKELLPGYYKDCKIAQKINQTQPTESGDMVLAFRDKRTANYWNGTWNPVTQELDLHPARSELQLNHWMQSHDRVPYDVIPIWTMWFDPQSDEVVNESERTINTFVQTHYFRKDFSQVKGALNKCPLIKRIMMHAISGGKDDDTFEQWLNWLAVIFQKRVKPQTAWVLHGVEGTGKGIIVNKILAPLLGRNYVQSKRASELEDKFNGWLEQALIGFIDEIKVSASARRDIISGDLRNFITEEYVTIRGMNKAAVQVKNYTGLIFSSNEDDPVHIKEMDRRYNVGHFQREKLKITQHEIDVVLQAELEHFMDYIMTREADVSKAASAIKNAAHAELVTNNKTSIDVTTNQIANGDLMALWDMRQDVAIMSQMTNNNSSIALLYESLVKRQIIEMAENPNTSNYRTRVLLKNKADSMVTAAAKLSRDDLLIIFEHCVGNMPKTPNKFTMLLKHRGINTQRIRINDSLQYGINVEWKVPASWLDEMHKEFEALRAKNKPKSNVTPLRKTS